MVKNTLKTDLGRVRVSDDAIAEIAATAALKVSGVAAMGVGGGLETLADWLGISQYGRGVAVEVLPREVILSLTVIVDFGADIAEVGLAVQESVVAAIETMTGLEVREIDVTIQGVRAKAR